MEARSCQYRLVLRYDGRTIQERPVNVDVLNGSARDALAFAALAQESYCVGVATVEDRLIAICDWDGERVAVLLHQGLLENVPGLMGALTFTHLMVPEVVDAPPELLGLFVDPMFGDCRPLVHEDEPALDATAR